MLKSSKAYVEHVAIWVNDIHWYINFFKTVLDMPMRRVEGSAENPEQYWTLGGMQFMSKPGFSAPEGRLAHIGIMCEDLEEALRRAADFGVQVMPQGANWIRLPDGTALEFLQASPGAVHEALSINPRAS